MKKTRFILIILMILSSTYMFSQNASTTKGNTNNKAKIEKSKVPKAVTDLFYIQFPKTSSDSWFGVPPHDNLDEWWDNWYEDGPYLNSDNPDYYIVEYSIGNVPYKAVYSKNGNKVATHKILKSDLPKAVSAAISNGKYKGWKLEKDKEEIFKDKDTDQMKVYKVSVKKGEEMHILFFQADGKLLKDKKVS